MANTALKEASDKPHVMNWKSHFFQNKNKETKFLLVIQNISKKTTWLLQNVLMSFLDKKVGWSDRETNEMLKLMNTYICINI